MNNATRRPRLRPHRLFDVVRRREGTRFTIKEGDSISHVFHALGHNTRREIVERLREGDATVTDIAANFSVSLNTISRHITVLEKAGVVSRRVVGREHRIGLNLSRLLAGVQWATEQAEFWQQRMVDLERAAQSVGKKS